MSTTDNFVFLGQAMGLYFLIKNETKWLKMVNTKAQPFNGEIPGLEVHKGM